MLLAGGARAARGLGIGRRLGTGGRRSPRSRRWLAVAIAGALVAQVPAAAAPAAIAAATTRNFLGVDQSPTLDYWAGSTAVALVDPPISLPASEQFDGSVYLVVGDPADPASWYVQVFAPAGMQLEAGMYADAGSIFGPSDKPRVRVGHVFAGDICAGTSRWFRIDELTRGDEEQITALSVDIVCNDPSPITVELRFNSAGAAHSVASTPAHVTFDRILAGTASATQDVTLSNAGPEALQPVASILEGGDATDFSITSDGCAGTTVEPGGTCSVSIGFSPADGPALERQALLRIPVDTAAGSRTVPLSGLVRRPTTLVVTSDSNPHVLGYGPTFTATVSPQPDRATFVWTVDGNDWPSSRSDTLTLQKVGAYSVTARFVGTDAYAPSSANTVEQVSYLSSWIRWNVWPAFNRPEGILDVTAYVDTTTSAPPAGTLTITDDTTGEVLGAATLDDGVAYVHLAAINLPGLHYLRATYSGVPPYRLPAESVVLIEGTPPTETPSVMQLLVGGLDTVQRAGTAGTATVTALDARGARGGAYRGTVRVTSSDPLAELPGDYTFTEADAGSHALPVTLHTEGDQSVTVADVETGSIVGTSHVMVTAPFAAAQVQPVAVSVGDQHTCGVGADGLVRCWGANDDGQLGDDTYIDAPVPVVAQGLTNATGVAAGGAHTCAVTAEGTVWCWGRDSSGQAPHPDGTNGRTPIPVPGITNATAVSAGAAHSCALLADGTVTCWGGISGGQAGPRTPTPVEGVANAIALASGVYHACALIADGSVRCWGDGSYGALGDGGDSSSATSVAVTGITTAVALDASFGSSCAALASGAVKCWGLNDEGQLGDGTTTDRATAVSVQGMAEATAVAVGVRYACARLGDGSVSCWGRNRKGQLGDGSVTSRVAPGLADIVGVTVIDAGPARTCALTAGELRCWGDNEHGELGAAIYRQFDPVAPSSLGPVAAISDHAPCVLLADGTVRCWGSNQSGQLGNGTKDPAPSPVTVVGLTGVVQLSGTGNASCAVKEDGTISCWGNNYFGLLGDGTMQDQALPVTVTEVTGASKVSVGYDHSCALLEDATIVCWGSNTWGQLGGPGANGSKVSVTGIGPATDVVAAYGHTCALLADGTVACWGVDNMSGSLGGSPGGPTPGFVPGITTATSLAGGHDTYCVVLSSHQVSCWGANEHGQAGDGTGVDRRTAGIVPGIDTAVAVAVSGHGCALLDDGRVRCWGSNGYGAIGDGTNIDRLAPAEAVPGITADAIGVGGVTRVRLVDGTVRAWGYGLDGGLGNGTAPYAPRPIAVSWPVTEPLKLAVEIAPHAGTLTVPVILTTSVGDAHVAMWYLGERPRDTMSWPNWPTEKPATFTFSAGDADRVLYAYVMDDRGSISQVAVATTLLDTTPPGSSVSLPAATRTQVVPIGLSAQDAGTGVAGWILSEIPIKPRADDPRWTVSAPKSVTLSAGDGTKRVYVWTKDGANNVSVPSAPKTLLDTLPPVGGTAPVASIRASSVTSTAVPVRTSWGAAVDGHSGAVGYELAMQRAGSASWTTIPRTGATARTQDSTLKPGTYRLRVRALDAVGNATAWRTAPTTTVVSLISDGSSAVAYTRTFARTAVRGAVGGYVRAASRAGSAAAIKVTARGLAFVSTRSSSRGKAQVWLDGVRVATIDLYAATTQPGRIVWSRTWSATETHRLRIVITGTKRSASRSTRVDVDSFVVLK